MLVHAVANDLETTTWTSGDSAYYNDNLKSWTFKVADDSMTTASALPLTHGGHAGDEPKWTSLGDCMIRQLGDDAYIQIPGFIGPNTGEDYEKISFQWRYQMTSNTNVDLQDMALLACVVVEHVKEVPNPNVYEVALMLMSTD